MGWQSATDKARRIIFISLNGNGTPMFARTVSPLTFCFTGFGWLALASILGMAIHIGLVTALRCRRGGGCSMSMQS